MSSTCQSTSRECFGKGTARSRTVLLRLFCATVLLGPNFSSAGVLTVTNSLEDGPGSVLQAVALALPGDTINFAVTGDISLSNPLNLTKNLTIDGPSGLDLRIKGTLQIGIGAVVTIRRLKLTANSVSSGAVRNSGTLFLETCVLADSFIAYTGPGIYNLGNLTANNCIIRSNISVEGDGGGIYIAAGTAVLSNCFILKNLANHGAGIWNSGLLQIFDSTISANEDNYAGCGDARGGGIGNSGTLLLWNTTVSGNKVSGTSSGAGIWNQGSISLVNSTITSNLIPVFGCGQAPGQGGGVWNGSTGTVSNLNSIFAGNICPNGGPDFFGTFSSRGFNLIQDTNGCTIVGITQGNLIGADPKLGPLQDNGGPTLTHSLLIGSPAIDGGTTAAAPNFDQRGVPRPQGSRVDMGAFEYYNPILTIGPLADQITCKGQNVSFHIPTTGSTLASYQWQFQGNPLSDGGRYTGSRSTDLRISNAQQSDSGVYSVLVSDLFGASSNSSVTLTVQIPPSMTQQPTNVIVNAGAELSICARATGTPPLSYQWRFNGNNILGATNECFHLLGAQSTNAGAYDVVVGNPCAGVMSETAILNVPFPYALPNPLALPAHDGFLRVVLEPAEAGGQWHFAWEPAWRNSGTVVAGLPTANYDIEFKPVSGFLAPVPRQISVVSGIQTTMTNSYGEAPFPLNGSLSVQILPDSVGTSPVLAYRGQWQIQGENNWHDSGDIVNGLNVGSYFVLFKPVSDPATPWVAPSAARAVVSANQIGVVTASYFLGDAPAVTTPVLVPSSYPEEIDKPYLYYGQILSSIGYGSGYVVKERVVLTAAHVVFNDATLSFASVANWFFQRNAGVYEPPPQSARGWYVFSAYSAQRSTEGTPGVSSLASRNLDAAALYFVESQTSANLPGRGGYGGFLVSDAAQNPFLTAHTNKVLAGYPVEGVQLGNRGKLNSVPEYNYSFTKELDRVYSTTDFTSFPGNSGGAVCAQCNGRYYPVAIYLGGFAKTLVCAIDSQVADLINRAEDSGNGGGNNTGGGVIIITPNLPGPGFVSGYVQIQLGPPSALAAGAAWRVTGTNAAAFGSLTNYTNYAAKIPLNNGAFRIQFKDLPDWSSPAARDIEVISSQGTIVPANYSVNPPLLLIGTNSGLRITGATGTLYRIEYKNSLAAGAWSTQHTGFVILNKTNTILGTLPSSPSTRFYRATWLP